MYSGPTTHSSCHGSFQAGGCLHFYDNWGQVTKLAPPELDAWDYFGFSVSLSGDDAIVSAYRDNGHRGSVYIFSRNEGGTNNWGRVKKISNSDGNVDNEFGYAVSISNGYTAASMPGDNDNGS